MSLILLIVMFHSGQVSQIQFDSVDRCLNARNELRQEIPKDSGYVTCVIK